MRKDKVFFIRFVYAKIYLSFEKCIVNVGKKCMRKLSYSFVFFFLFSKPVNRLYHSKFIEIELSQNYFPMLKYLKKKTEIFICQNIESAYWLHIFQLYFILFGCIDNSFYFLTKLSFQILFVNRINKK